MSFRFGIRETSRSACACEASSCGKCGVNVRGENGSVLRLACTVRAEDGMTVEIVPEVRVSFADTSEGEVYGPDPGQSGYAAAIDIGTTKVICQLLDLETGAQLRKVSGSNSQRVFGGAALPAAGEEAGFRFV